MLPLWRRGTLSAAAELAQRPAPQPAGLGSQRVARPLAQHALGEIDRALGPVTGDRALSRCPSLLSL